VFENSAEGVMITDRENKHPDGEPSILGDYRLCSADEVAGQYA
jgi:hypothetical protein